MRTFFPVNSVVKGSIGVAVGAFLLLIVGAGDLAEHAASGIWQSTNALSFDTSAFWMFFAALFAIMNPIVAVPYFVSLTESGTDTDRQRLVMVVTVAVLISLGAAAMFGRELLSFFAISVSSFRIAGGVIVFLMGLSLLNAKMASKDAASEDSSARPEPPTSRASEAICPLAFPLLVGPGSIATIILRTESAETTSDFVTVAAVIVAMVLTTYLVLLVALPLARFLGHSGLTVLTRLIGMIVAAIAVDMIVIGLGAIVPGVGG